METELTPTKVVERGDDAAGARSPSWPLYVAAAIVPFVVYLPILGHGFVFDDFLLFRSASLQDLGSIAKGFRLDLGKVRGEGDTVFFSYYRPIFLAFSTLYYQVVGGGTVGWHAASLVLAGAVGSFACALLVGFGVPPRLALLSSVVFSLHPSHVSSVAWASGLQELLAAFFALGSLLALRSAAAASGPWALALATESFALALLSKEVAIAVLPFVALWALAAARSKEEGARELGRATALFAIVTVVYLGVRLAAFGHVAAAAPGAPGFIASAASIPIALRAYLEILLAPVGFGFFRPERPAAGPFAPPVLASLAVLACAVALAVVAVRRNPRSLLPIAWFGIWLLPVLNVWALDPQWMVTDRYLFLPALALPWTIATLLPYRPAAIVLTVLAVVFAALTLRYETIFESERTFFAAMERAEPTSATVFAERGRLLMADGDVRGAEAALRRAVELGPPLPQLLVALADIEIEKGDVQAAEAHYRSALAARPYPSRGLKLLAVARSRAGKAGEAMELVEMGVRLWPADFELQLLRALLLAARGERAAAEAAFARAGALDPDDPTIRGGFDAALANVLPGMVPSARSGSDPTVPAAGR